MDAPTWFQQAVSHPRISHFIEVSGCQIHYDIWASAPGKPALLFVHGNAAHSHWWDFIAPAFAKNYCPIAMDLSGTGDSGHRDQYSAVTFANEIIEVCRASGCASAYVVGHSFGGSMARIAGFLHGTELAGIVLVDSGISSNRGMRTRPAEPTTGIRYYDDIEMAKRRFRLRPPQPCDNDYILDYIARHSLAEAEQGFRFKVDQSMFSKMIEAQGVDLPDAVTMIRGIPCPVGFIYGARSRFFPPEAVALLQGLIAPDLIFRIEAAHHHLFLDQPLAFIDALKTLLARPSFSRS